MKSEPGRRARQKEEREQRILSAARDLFSEFGFEATTTRQIADRADVGAGTVFNYFPSKIALLLRLFQHELGKLRQRAFATVDTAAPLSDQILGVFTQVIDYYEARPRLARVLVKELLFLEEGTQRGEMLQFALGFHLALQPLVVAAQARREIRGDVPPIQIAYHAFAIYWLGLVTWLGGFVIDRPTLDLQLRAGLNLFLDGLTPRACEGMQEC